MRVISVFYREKARVSGEDIDEEIEDGANGDISRTLVRARVVQQQIDVPVVFQVVRQDDFFLQVKH